MIIFPKRKSVSIAGGSLSILLGLAALIWPSVTAEIVTALIGAFLLMDAVFSFLSQDRRAVFTWAAVAQGAVGLVVALLLVFAPGTALRVLVILIALWVVIRSAIQLWIAFQYRSTRGAPLFAGLTGALSLLVGILLLVRPEAGIIAFSWLVGLYAVISGGLMIAWVLRAPRIEG